DSNQRERRRGLVIGMDLELPAIPSALAEEVLAAARGRPLAIVCDFDGTISDIVPRPADARIRADAPAALTPLPDSALVTVASGRSLDDLASRVELDDVALAGEHGAQVRLLSGEERVLDLSPSARIALDAFARYAERLLAGTEGEVERKVFATAAHTRRLPA